MGVCPSADSLNPAASVSLKALQFYLKKINERPDKYEIVRTTKDIDDAIKDVLSNLQTHNLARAQV